MHHHHPSRSYSSNSSSSDESSWSSSESGSSLGRGSRRTSTTTVSSDTSDDDNEVSDDSPKAGPSRTTVEIATEEEQEEENVPRGEPNEFCRGVERQTGHQSSSSSTRPLRTLSLSVQSGEDDEEWKLKELSTIKTTRRGLSDPPWKAPPLSSQQEPLLPLHVRPKLTSPTLDPPPQQLKLLDALRNALLRSTPSFEPPSALLDGPTLPSSSSPSPSITSKNTPLLQLLHPRWSTSSSSSHIRSTRTPTCASPTPTSPTTTRKLLRSAALILRSVLTYFAVSVACLWLAGDVYYYLGFLLGFRSTAYKAAFWTIVGLACCGFQYAGVRLSHSPFLFTIVLEKRLTCVKCLLSDDGQFWMIVHLGRQLAVLWQLDLQKYERPLAGVLRRWRFVSPSPELVGSPLEEGTRGWGRGREREGVV